jgi:CBS domain-containing protein
MIVADVMTRAVLTIGPEASLRDVARVMLEHRISGLPVCGDRRQVLGVVSEGDLIYKDFDPTDRPGGALAWIVDGTSPHAVLKSRATTVAEAMTAPAVTVAPGAPVAEAARRIVDHGVRRLPVVEGDVLVGIVTRSDLMRALVRPDAEIRADVEVALDQPPGSTAGLRVEVERGCVRLTGEVGTRTHARLLERRAGHVPGVIHVTSEVTWAADRARLGVPSS